jgi:hypothetical protein
MINAASPNRTGLATRPMFVFDIGMTVPRLHIAMPRLHESHTAFHKSTSHQQLAILRSFAVQLLNMFRLLRNIKRITGFRLHAKRQFKRLDARFDRRFARAFGLMLSIQLLQKFELP